jgi:hypothetical protein
VRAAIEALLRPKAQTTVFHPSEIELTKITTLCWMKPENRPRAWFSFAFRFRDCGAALRYDVLLNLKQEFAKKALVCCWTTR